MNRGRAIAGICALGALVISAIVAQGAIAAGTTAHTCAPAAGTPAGFSKEHCKPADAVPVGANFKHVSIAEGTTTELTATNANTTSDTTGSINVVTKATFAGIALEFKATGANATGTITNSKSNGEHYAHGTLTITTTGVTVNSPGCQVFTDNGIGTGDQGVVHTEPLKFTTLGQGDNIKIEPETGTVLKAFELANCNNANLNRTYTINGSYKCPMDGATIVCAHLATTEQNTLFLLGATKAGVAASWTLKARANSSQSYTPISFTT